MSAGQVDVRAQFYAARQHVRIALRAPLDRQDVVFAEALRRPLSREAGRTFGAVNDVFFCSKPLLGYRGNRKLRDVRPVNLP